MRRGSVLVSLFGTISVSNLGEVAKLGEASSSLGLASPVPTIHVTEGQIKIFFYKSFVKACVGARGPDWGFP